MPKFRHPKVVVRRLGKHRAWGLFDGEIHIDERLRGKRKMEILIHEYLHFLDYEKPEEKVDLEARKITDYLWRQGARFADNETHLPP